jgi:hypothetical protein
MVSVTDSTADEIFPQFGIGGLVSVTQSLDSSIAPQFGGELLVSVSGQSCWSRADDGAASTDSTEHAASQMATAVLVNNIRRGRREDR